MQTNKANLMTVCRHRDRRRPALAALALAAIIGCSKSDGRVNLSGSVSWKGQPVTSGFVVFDPDVAAGNIGPQGMAPIESGRYDTRSKGGRPVSPGPQHVSIHGFDGHPMNEDNVHGKRLFMPAEITVTAPQVAGELNLVVPDSVPGLR